MSVSEQTRKQANLRLLRRICLREINDIVQTATHVVLYDFNMDAWQKSNFEGSLFLTQTPAKYHLVILNRHGTENLQMDITDSMELQDQDPYLIFKERIGDATRIRGFWFHNADERVAMAAALQRSIERLQVGSLPPLPTTPAPTASPAPRPPSSSSQRTSPLTYAHALTTPFPEPSNSASAAALAPLFASLAVSSTESAAAAAAAAATTTPSMSRASSFSPSLSPAGGGSGSGVALDKKSLQLALLSLIQDDRFLDLIHSQYLRVAHARVKKQQQQQQPDDGNS